MNQISLALEGTLVLSQSAMVRLISGLLELTNAFSKQKTIFWQGILWLAKSFTCTWHGCNNECSLLTIQLMSLGYKLLAVNITGNLMYSMSGVVQGWNLDWIRKSRTWEITSHIQRRYWVPPIPLCCDTASLPLCFAVFFWRFYSDMTMKTSFVLQMFTFLYLLPQFSWSPEPLTATQNIQAARRCF